MAEVSKADFDYYNGAIKRHTTDSSTLISSSPYLNNPALRQLIAQEMLRRTALAKLDYVLKRNAKPQPR